VTVPDENNAPADATDSHAPAPGTEPAPRSERSRLIRALSPRATRRQAVIGILFVALGFAGIAVARGTGTTGLLATASEDEVVRVLDDLTERQARLEIEQRALEATRDRLLSGSEEQRLAVSRARADALAILAGTVPATGTGIRMSIEDPAGTIDYTVLLDTMQELRDAGAEAIQIGNVRVVASTWFDDAPDSLGIVVSGTRLAPPYRIIAIGGSTTLATALEIPGGVADTVRTAGGRITVTPSTSVLVSALQPLTTPQYARPAASPSSS
jgi:uncharacterized protein YlxW (UPF0749 family)